MALAKSRFVKRSEFAEGVGSSGLNPVVAIPEGSSSESSCDDGLGRNDPVVLGVDISPPNPPFSACVSYVSPRLDGPGVGRLTRIVLFRLEGDAPVRRSSRRWEALNGGTRKISR